MSGWLAHYPKTQARSSNFSRGRQGYRPLWVVIHCTDTPYADNYPKNLGTYWAREDVKVSVHFGVSDTQTYQYVSMDDTAFQARNPGNLRGIGIEVVGKAKWSRNEWMAHRLALRRTAKLVAEISLAYGIKTVPALLSPQDLRARKSGLTCHGDLSRAFNGTHTDPAPNFPWDAFLIEVRNALGGVDEERARVAAGRVSAPSTQEDALMAVTEKDFDELVKKVGRLNSQADRSDSILTGGASYEASRLGKELTAIREELRAVKESVAALAAKA